MPPPPLFAHKALLLLLLSLSLALAHDDGSNHHHQLQLPVESTTTNDDVDDDGSSATCAAVVQDKNVTTAVGGDFTDDLNAWGIRQWIGFDHVARKAMEVVDSTKQYMMSIEKNNGDYEKCRNKDVLCTYYAANNECDREDVTENCSPVCQTCERLALGYDDYQVPYGGPNQQLIAYGDPDSALVQVEKTVEYMKTIDYKCLNKNELCVVWAVEGECKANPMWMAQNCAPECQTCEQYEDDDGEDVASDWGPTQWKELPDDDQFFEYDKEAVLLQLDRTRTYMTDKDHDLCVNKDERCAIWASAGECEENTQWMETNCAPECQSCDMIQTYEQRCPFDVDDLTTALQPGDLHRLFERIVNDVELIEQYGPLTILSSPNTTNGPWVITLDNFLSGEECDRFIDIGTEQGYQRSQGVGEYNADGTFEKSINERRTSTNSWCSARCYEDEYTKHVFPRIERLTGISRDHSEELQLLRYEVGQKYNNHHDFIEHDTKRMQGPRILTVFMYLNNVEAGGGTRFERLHNLTVTPKRGRVVMWPSVLNEMPRVMDPRTHHEALPVESGEKYGANSWIHQNDLVAAEEEGCS